MRRSEVISLMARAHEDSPGSKPLVWCRVDMRYPFKPEWQQVRVIYGGFSPEHNEWAWLISYGHPLSPTGSAIEMVRSSRLRAERPFSKSEPPL